jgi:alpha-ketoglutarate-dependent taurine dioxygenase
MNNIRQAGLPGVQAGAIESPLPHLIQAFSPTDLAAWVSNHPNETEAALLKYGAILFRGFSMKTEKDFERFIDCVFTEPLQYVERSTPRTQLSGKVYTSTEYPPHYAIALHNESSYSSTWPGKICFYCLVPPELHGETPIADVRNVYKRIDPQIIDLFSRKGWMLVRNYSEGLGLSWQTAFQTSDKSVAEAHCHSARVEWQWKGDQLSTRQTRPAVARHPRTGEMVWFNHIVFWHVSSLEPEVRQAMLEVMGEEELPYNTFFGDGAPIAPAIVEELRLAYEQEKVVFPWQYGDVLLLDNMLVAHGRNHFKGQRRILVAMGEPCSLEAAKESNSIHLEEYQSPDSAR